MLTFNQLYTEAQRQVRDTDTTASLPLLKQAINQGMRKFGAILNREWRVSYKTFSTVASQQFYQMPEDAIRAKSVKITVGSITYPLEEIGSEQVWDELNMRSTQTSAAPQFFFVRGSDEFGIWPAPSAVNTGTLAYERRMRDMSVADYSTGTIALTNGSAAVVGTGTTFTQAMVGRSIIVSDANGDGMAYKVITYNSSTSLTIENNYGGTTASGLSYVIGEVPDIPEEFHESLIDYACYRYYKRRKDASASRDMKAAFQEALNECQADYSSKTSSNYSRAHRAQTGYVHLRRDLTVIP